LKNINILFKTTTKLAKLPKQASKGSVGYDLFSLTPAIIPPKTQSLIPTGLSCKIPTGYYGQLASQSGFTSKLKIFTMPGVIDNDFRGEIKILLKNDRDDPFTIPLNKPISQLLIIPYASFQPKLVNHLSKTSQGAGGFSSSDNTVTSLGTKGEIIQLSKSTG